MIKITGLDALTAKLAKAQVMMEQKVAEVVEKKLRLVFTDLVKSTPQYTGNLASNWYIELGDKSPYRQLPEYKPPGGWVKWDEPYEMGKDPAVSNTLDREFAKLQNLRTYLFSSSEHKIKLVNTSPYAEAVEANQGPDNLPIRAVNIHPEYAAVAMKGYTILKYGKMKYNGK